MSEKYFNYHLCIRFLKHYEFVSRSKLKREMTKLTVEVNSGNLAVTEYCNLVHDLFGL